MKRWLLAALAPLAVAASPSTPLATLGPDLAEARATFRAGEQLWPGYSSAPSGMLLITADQETLLCQPDPPKDFRQEGRDPATGCDVYIRARSGLPANLLAAMPVLGPASTIVMGTPAATGFERTDWLRTILHEHFHQWQTSRPGYFARVDALDLKGGDASGMWMLNFAFPYADPNVGAAYARTSLALADAIAARKSARFLPAFDRYLQARATFARSAGIKNWRYLEFELWQEGGARWTEYALASISPDAETAQAALAGEQRTLARLRTPNLEAQGRDLVYTLGTAEIMLVDSCGSGWRKSYRSATGLGPLIYAARKKCHSRSGMRR